MLLCPMERLWLHWTSHGHLVCLWYMGLLTSLAKLVGEKKDARGRGLGHMLEKQVVCGLIYVNIDGWVLKLSSLPKSMDYSQML